MDVTARPPGGGVSHTTRASSSKRDDTKLRAGRGGGERSESGSAM